MFDLPEDMDSWTQQEWHDASIRLAEEKLKDPNYKNTILERLIYREIVREASSELSDIAYQKRLEKRDT